MRYRWPADTVFTQQVLTVEQLLSYRNARPPADEQEAIKRRKVMRKARSKKKRPALLDVLDQPCLLCWNSASQAVAPL